MSATLLPRTTSNIMHMKEQSFDWGHLEEEAEAAFLHIASLDLDGRSEDQTTFYTLYQHLAALQAIVDIQYKQIKDCLYDDNVERSQQRMDSWITTMQTYAAATEVPAGMNDYWYVRPQACAEVAAILKERQDLLATDLEMFASSMLATHQEGLEVKSRAAAFLPILPTANGEE